MLKIGKTFQKGKTHTNKLDKLETQGQLESGHSLRLLKLAVRITYCTDTGRHQHVQSFEAHNS